MKEEIRTGIKSIVIRENSDYLFKLVLLKYDYMTKTNVQLQNLALNNNNNGVFLFRAS